MAYEKVWPDGWKDNEEGGTYIDAAGLNHIENGIIANDKAITEVQESIKTLTTADETNLAEAKRYSDTTLVSAKKYSDTNLDTAKGYTDSTAATLRSTISATDEKISALDKKLGGLTFAINSADRGLDIIVD